MFKRNNRSKIKKNSKSTEIYNDIDISTSTEMIEVKKTSSTVIVLSVLFIIAIFIGTFVVLMNSNDINTLHEILREADYRWILFGIICLILMWLAETVNMHIPLKRLYPSQKFSNSIKITMIGQLFNNLTPFSTGGQVMQVYEMGKSGKRTSDTLSILSMKFLVQQITMMLFSVFVLISQFNYFKEVFSNYIVIGIIGVLINVALLGVLIAAGTNKEVIMKIARPCIKLFSKIRIGKFRFIKDANEKIENFDKSVQNYSEQFRIMHHHKSMVFKMAIAGLIQAITYYALTYAVYKTFGNTGKNFFEIATLQIFLVLLITIVPTPGAGLGAEGGFALIFSPIVREGTVSLSVLFWRIYTFYLPILIGALFMIPTKRTITKRIQKDSLLNYLKKNKEEKGS